MCGGLQSDESAMLQKVELSSTDETGSLVHFLISLFLEVRL